MVLHIGEAILKDQGACQNGRRDALWRVGVMTIWTFLCFVGMIPGSVSPATAASVEESPEEPVLVVGKVSINLGDVFSEQEVQDSNPFLKFMQKGMNNLHISTRENVLRREILFQSGDRFDADLLSETERNLRSLGFLNNVFVVATDTTANGQVNIEVLARDSWTLKASGKYTQASNGDKRWSASLSESNFLGRGTTIGGGVGATEISSYWNLWYRHRRMFGSRLWFGIDFSELEEGHAKKIFISRPFFAQSDPWFFHLEAWDNKFEMRYYLSHAGPSGLDPASSINLNALLPQHEKGFEGSFLIRAKGRNNGRIWRLGGGLLILDSETKINPEGNILSDGRLVNLDYLLAEGEPLELFQGLTVNPFVWLQTKGRRWTKESFVMQYGAVEDIPLGITLDIKAGIRGSAVGSTSGCVSQFHGEMDISRWSPLLGGMTILSSRARLSTGPDNCSTHRVSLLGGWVGKGGSDHAPWLTRIFVEAGHSKNLAGSEVFVLGLDRGLRTLDFDGMAGSEILRWNVEQGKALSWQPGGLVRFGGAVFYNGGLAKFDDEERNLADARHEVGVGIRMGPVRSANAQMGRLDISWPLDGSSGVVFTATSRGTF
jgi:hypothetical protein